MEENRQIGVDQSCQVQGLLPVTELWPPPGLGPESFIPPRVVESRSSLLSRCLPPPGLGPESLIPPSVAVIRLGPDFFTAPALDVSLKKTSKPPTTFP